MAEERQAVDTPTGDNPTGDFMMDTLNEFNKGPKEGSPDENQEGESNTSNQEAVTETEAKDWLIKNKFRNDVEGVTKLAESYKNLQSEKDKTVNEYSEKDKKYEKLEQLDSFLKENPQVVSNIREQISSASDGSKPPEKPDDYDPYEESVDGSSSQKYRQDYEQYLMQMGAESAKAELNGFRQELAAKEAVDDEQKVLMNLGLNESEINEYREFINSPDVVTPENLVNIWRFMSQQKMEKTSQQAPSNESSGPTGRTSLASVSGVTPSPRNSQKKEVDEFMDGLMKFSNNNSYPTKGK